MKNITPLKKTLLISFLFLLTTAKLFSQMQTVADKVVDLTATVQKNPARITLKWTINTSTLNPTVNFNIYRKLKSGTNFNTLLATLSASATQFTDSNIVVGTSYEYFVKRNQTWGVTGYGYINSGIEIPVTENRGKLILIVDSTFTSSLSSELTRLETDLEGDGWTVIRHDVSRTGSVGHVKSFIVSDYNKDPLNTKSVFLFGHVPVPYSGNTGPDGHGDHQGAWSTDTYYGDVNGIWTDLTVTSTTAAPTRIQNVPGDGKFDQSAIPGTQELQVGRIDLSDLVSFSTPEQKLLQLYLNKDHDYRKKVFSTVKRAVIDDNFGYLGSEAPAACGWKNFSTLVGRDSVFAKDYSAAMTYGNYLWSYGCGGGQYTYCSGVLSVVGGLNVSNLNGIFTVLFGSYFGDFDTQDNLMRATLAQGKMLTCIWGGRPEWMLHHMAMGDNIGYSTIVSQNNSGLYYNGPGWPLGVSMNLMGDPSLRGDVVSPVSNVVATKVGLNCKISWSASTQTNVLGYNIYMKNDSNNIYSRINSNLITGTNYTDNCLMYKGIYKYMVRAVVLEITPSGSYYNMSEGIADTALNNSYLKVYLTANSNYTNSVNTVTFTSNGANITTYSWNFGDGGTSIAQNPIHTYTANGSYTTTLIADNSCDADTTYLFMMFDVGINTFTKSSNSVLVYPNPASDIITISGISGPFFDLLVYNAEGQLVYQEESITNKKEIDVSKFKSGLYLLILIDENNRNYSKKFVVE